MGEVETPSQLALSSLLMPCSSEIYVRRPQAVVSHPSLCPPPQSLNTQERCGVPERALALESDRPGFESYLPAVSLRTSHITSQTQCLHL